LRNTLRHYLKEAPVPIKGGDIRLSSTNNKCCNEVASLGKVSMIVFPN